MWRIAAGVILAAASIQAQAVNDLLLPQARRIQGKVVDPKGEPVAQAHIEHTNDLRQAHLTDSGGRFELDTRAPIVVVRKPRFRSELVRVQGEAELQVTLQELKEVRPLPTCSNTGSYVGIDGWEAVFRFPRTSGVKASRQGQDIDYGARNYYVETKSGPQGIGHGSGPFWGFGTPSDQDVWRSVRCEETTYDFGDLPIVDAKGLFSNGKRWRYLGKFGESASYSGVDEVTAKTLDRFLDGACLKPLSRR